MTLRIDNTPCHHDECEHYPLDCGTVNIERKDIHSHRKVCPLEPVDCIFKDAGCTDKMLRKDMENHLETRAGEHLPMILRSHLKLLRSWLEN